MQKKQVYGLIGFPVEHSLSPQMQMAAFRELVIDAEYKLFERTPEKLESFLTEEVFALGLAGFNITIPHKVRAREILEKNYPTDWGSKNILQALHYVKLTGAVNTVKVVGKRLKYFNTDATGFRRSLGESLRFEPKDKEILLIGCGGAGRTVIAALGWRNVGVRKIYIYDINEASVNSAKEHFLSSSPHANFLADKLQFIQTSDLKKVINKCSLLVNASPIGMKDPQDSPIDKSLLHKELSVYDVVYNRNDKTQLIKDALARDLPVADGLEMLLYQGADAFSIWTQQEAPIDEMRKALNKGIQ